MTPCATREGGQRRYDPRKNDLRTSGFAELPLSPSLLPFCLHAPLVVFIFGLNLLAQPNKYQNVSLQSLKNRLVNKFDRLIHSIVLELFFVKVYIMME